MSDIEDYLSDNDSDSVVSSESEEKPLIKKPFKKPVQVVKQNIYHETEEDEDIGDEGDVDEDEDEDEVILNDDVVADDDDDDEDDDDEVDDDDENDDENDYYDEQEGGAKKEKKPKKSAVIAPSTIKKPVSQLLFDSDDDDDDDDDENYLQKFDQDINRNYVKENHPERIIHNYEEVKILSEVVRDSNNIIIDPFHKTIPFLTKYERARILGQRAKQIESGAKPFVKVPENIIDGYIIAELELKQKKIPFILRRPLPNGGCEYWNLKDLEVITF